MVDIKFGDSCPLWRWRAGSALVVPNLVVPLVGGGSPYAKPGSSSGLLEVAVQLAKGHQDMHSFLEAMLQAEDPVPLAGKTARPVPWSGGREVDGGSCKRNVVPFTRGPESDRTSGVGYSFIPLGPFPLEVGVEVLLFVNKGRRRSSAGLQGTITCSVLSHSTRVACNLCLV